MSYLKKNERMSEYKSENGKKKFQIKKTDKWLSII